MNFATSDNTVEPVLESTILADYRQKLQLFASGLSDLRARRSRTLILLTALVVLLAAMLWAAFVSRKLPPALSALPLIGMVFAFRKHEILKASSLELARRDDFYRRGVDRLTGVWRGKGVAGEEFARDYHLYQWDLDILGEGSLFELLCTTRSEVGAERLAEYLLDPVGMEEARSRQSAVKELRDTSDLREEIALLGTYEFLDCSRQSLRDWLNMPVLKVNRAIPVFLLASSIVCAILGLLGLTTLISWSHIAPYLAPLAFLQISLAAFFWHRVHPLLKILETLTNEFAVLRAGLELMERQQFHCPKLVSLVQSVHGQKAASQVRKLERLVSKINRRKNEAAYLPSLFLALGTQLAFAVEKWRSLHQKDLETWLDCWAEFEALNALAGYAYEHPQNTFPEIVGSGAIFEATQLRHPLLAHDVCVGNDIVLNPESRFIIISGSNMAGKSTVLRTIGMNSILAFAGAPVCATNARTAVFTVCASISIADSMRDGKSKFLAEVERLKGALDAMKGTNPVLFLIDEILSGTNSKDRKTAAETIIASLMAGGAVGALSTHDLTLSQIAEIPESCGVNLHMESESLFDPLDFDYRLKPGTSRKSNAWAILDMVGIGSSASHFFLGEPSPDVIPPSSTDCQSMK